MRRRTLLKAILAAGVSPSLLPLGAKELKVKEEKPRGDRLVKKELGLLANTGVQDDDCLCGEEEVLLLVYNLYSVDEKGNLTFLKTLSTEGYRMFLDEITS